MQSQSLKTQMGELVLEIARIYKEAKNKYADGEDIHSHVYHQTCAKFDLYNEYGRAPLWLSRVVDGVIKDYPNVSV